MRLGLCQFAQVGDEDETRQKTVTGRVQYSGIGYWVGIAQKSVILAVLSGASRFSLGFSGSDHARYIQACARIHAVEQRTAQLASFSGGCRHVATHVDLRVNLLQSISISVRNSACRSFHTARTGLLNDDLMQSWVYKFGPNWSNYGCNKCHRSTIRVCHSGYHSQTLYLHHRHRNGCNLGYKDESRFL